VLNDGQMPCVLCQFHSQECTFLQEPTTRKRKTLDDRTDLEPSSAHAYGIVLSRYREIANTLTGRQPILPQPHGQGLSNVLVVSSPAQVLRNMMT
jgi:hypothetical protein